MRVKDAVGRFGEDVAARFLADAGLEILDRNWRCAEGELDIVGRDGDDLVVVEVKTRSGVAFGTPAEAVDARKAARLRRLTILWIEAHRGDPERSRWRSVRIDVVAVLRRRGGPVTVEHLVGVL